MLVVPAAAANSSVALRWSHRGQSGEDRRRTGDAGLDVRGTGPTGAIRLDGKSKRNHENGFKLEEKGDVEVLEIVGAGEGNRTLVFSLEGCCSTIELHPRWT